VFRPIVRGSSLIDTGRPKAARIRDLGPRSQAAGAGASKGSAPTSGGPRPLEISNPILGGCVSRDQGGPPGRNAEIQRETSQVRLAPSRLRGRRTVAGQGGRDCGPCTRPAAMPRVGVHARSSIRPRRHGPGAPGRGGAPPARAAFSTGSSWRNSGGRGARDLVRRRHQARPFGRWLRAPQDFAARHRARISWKIRFAGAAQESTAKRLVLG